MKIDTSEIIVGDRARKDIDNGISPLCQSIRDLGQLQPILVDDDFNLIAGARRHRACELLGIQVETYIVKSLADAVQRLRAERDENTCRLDFTTSEAVEIGRRIEAMEAPKAAERMKAGKPSSDSDQGRTDDKIAEAVDMSRDTYRKAKSVVDNGTPELVEAMDAGAVSINTASKAAKLEPAQQAEVVQAAKTSKHAAVQALKSLPPSNVGALADMPTEDEINQDIDQPLTVKRIGVGVLIAQEAVDKLNKIPKKDALAGRAHQIIRGWLKDHSDRRRLRPTDKSAVISVEYAVEGKITTLLNRIKKSSGDAVERLPVLSNQLRALAKRLEEYADEVDAKREAVK